MTTNRRIAIFTDSHSLLEPTEAVLKDIRKKGIDEIYSLGDNIGLGPNPSEVMNLFEEYNVISLAGNYEEIVRLGIDPFLSYLSVEKKDNMEWTKSVLREDQKNRIETFKPSINLTLGNKNIALCHFPNDIRCDFKEHGVLKYMASVAKGNPNYRQFYYTNSIEQINEFLNILELDIKLSDDINENWQKIRTYINRYRFILERKRKILGYLAFLQQQLFMKNNEVLTVSDYDAIIAGHSHFDTFVSDGKTNYYTIRSVGLGYSEEEKDLAQYVILTETIEGFEMEVVKVPFDRDKMEYSILNCVRPNEIIRRYTKMKCK